MGSVPLRPWLAPWYRLAVDDDRVLLEHARSVVLLEGAAVRDVVCELLALLDGSRTLDELVTALGPTSRSAVEATVRRLSELGLVLEGPEHGGRAPTPAAPAVSALAAAYGRAPQLVADRLQTARIGVLGESLLAARAVRVLQRAGALGTIEQVSVADAAELEFVVVTPSARQVSLSSEWNQAALESGTCWIGVRPFDGLALAIGPLVVPGESACYECLRLRLASHLEYGAELKLLESRPAVATCGPALELVAVGIVAQLTLDWVVGADRTLPGTLHLVEAWPSIDLTRHAVPRVPRCPACSTAERVAPRVPWHQAELTAEAAA